MKETEIFKAKSILITGGTGSFGKAFVKKLLQEEAFRRVILFSRDEWKQWEMRNSSPLFDHPSLRYFLGDVRDKDRLTRAFRDVDYVIHAAALKQVPAAEYNPTEFVNTNILGTKNVIDAALDCKVEKVIVLSTDKAVNPVNLYGATKLCAEKFTIAANSYVGAIKRPRFSVVRYGNVSGTRGSVIPHWKTLIESGDKELPITHPDMTRFWITLEQATTFVKECLLTSVGSEIFIPKIPSIQITDLAEAIAPNLKVAFSEIRAGEKLHEVLINSDEARHAVEFDNHYLILPEKYGNNPNFIQPMIDKLHPPELPAGFSYCSNTNTDWLTVKDLKGFVAP